ncbi:MAG: hypothetical protein IT381_22030 [Deltaproteobacteria bacterium]|nr:hypothetical protein [Deltaproteobacteria bacterium]
MSPNNVLAVAAAKALVLDRHAAHGGSSVRAAIALKAEATSACLIVL